MLTHGLFYKTNPIFYGILSDNPRGRRTVRRGHRFGPVSPRKRERNSAFTVAADYQSSSFPLPDCISCSPTFIATPRPASKRCSRQRLIAWPRTPISAWRSFQRCLSAAKAVLHSPSWDKLTARCPTWRGNSRLGVRSCSRRPRI